MSIRVFLGAVVCTTLLAVAADGLLAREVAREGTWVRLHSARIDPVAPALTLTLPEDTPRIQAIRFVAPRGRMDVTRVVVNYSNGQVHFEDRAIALRQGEPSRTIDKRKEERIIDSIALTFQTGGPPRSVTEIEVWGIGVPAKQAKFRGNARRYAEVPVFYGTTRKRETDRTKNSRALAVFSGEQGDDLTLGRSIVTVPLERAVGSISRPEFVARFSFRNEDPNRDFTIAAVDVMTKDDFVGEMKKQVGRSTRYKGQALVFVHGYNVSFDDAIFRAAQIAHDIEFDGPAVAFSWPSRGGTWDYVYDINTAKGSRDGLRALLEMIARDTGVSAVNLIAHSMGNDPVIEVLREEAEIASRKGQVRDFKLNEIIMAAPDVSRSVFEKYVSRFASLASGGVTLLASSNDLAMAASKRVARGLVRAGDVPKDGIIVLPGIESIDVSAANTEFFSTNHSTFADREHLVTDLRLLLERTSNKHPPDVRSAVYRPAGPKTKQWWRYSKN